MKTPFNIKEKAYEKQNRKMRKEYKSETGKTLGKRLTKGVRLAAYHYIRCSVL